jgi:molybdopterin synthase catalytic subunit
MRVRVLFFGMLKDLVGRSSDTLELPEGSTITDLLKHYEARIPNLKDSLSCMAVAVNQEYAAAATQLKSDDEVALLPPVSGGSGDRESESYASIVRDPIDASRILANIKCGADGAVVIFEGVVRNQTRGRKTLFLDYEAYEEMALQQMERLAQQALKDFPDSRCRSRPPFGTPGDWRNQRADRGCLGSSRPRVRRLPLVD